MLSILCQSDSLTQVGVGGVLVILILKLVFEFVGKRQQKTSSSNDVQLPNVVTRPEFENHKESVQYKDTCIETVKRFDTSITAQGKQLEKLDSKIDKGFTEVKSLIRNGHG